jgi:hypothetical protein
MTVASVEPDVVVVVYGLPVAVFMQEIIHSLCAININFSILSLNNAKQTFIIRVLVQLKINIL